jgi:hypothetical protein
MSSARWHRGLLKGLLIAGGAGALFVVVMGFAHTRAGRPLLALLGRTLLGGKTCPLGYDQAASPAAREATRARFAAAHRGDVAAASRPALGFALDRTSPDEVSAFMAGHRVACRRSTGMADLICDGVPSDALPAELGAAPPREVWFNFGADRRLISVVAVSQAPAAVPIGAAFTGATAAVARGAGPPAKVDGDPAGSWLMAGLLRQASAEFRFSDYYASARATNMGGRFVLTEEYRSLPN